MFLVPITLERSVVDQCGNVTDAEFNNAAELQVWYDEEVRPKLSEKMKKKFQGVVLEADGHINAIVKQKYSDIYAKVKEVEELEGDEEEGKNFLKFSKAPVIQIPALEDDVCMVSLVPPMFYFS